jgi:predicted enzyme related to lactoylglutathione lyase
MAGARIDYVELPTATAHELTRAFYAKAFGWASRTSVPTIQQRRRAMSTSA